jgi:hypothetical protein
MASPSETEDFISILAPYDPEAANSIQEKHANGIDVLDELYEALCVHDEYAADAYRSL